MSLPRYAAVGALATASHYAMLVGLVEGGMADAAPAAMMGALVGAAVAYWGNRRWTFAQSTQAHGVAARRFATIAALGAGLNGLIVHAGTVWMAWHYLPCQIMATVAVMWVTYHLNRWWTFGSKP